MEEKKYYSAEQILRFLGLDYEFEKKNRDYPFNRGFENVELQWPNITIPKGNIEKALWNKVRGINNDFKSEINMLVQVPFKTKMGDIGVIHVDLSLEWRYDKQFKYGDITTTFEEVCLYIFDRATRSNHYYIIGSEWGLDFMSYYVIPNQWGKGRLTVSSACMVSLQSSAPIDNGNKTETATQ